jgi:hypothetical protein
MTQDLPMKRTPLLLFTLFVAVVPNTASWAMDPNAACADAIPVVRKLLMDESAMARNLLEPVKAFFDGEPFSVVAEKIRKGGAEKLISDIIATADERDLCDKSRKNCYTRDEVLAHFKPAIPRLDMWPKLYDAYYLFEEIKAVDYEPNVQRATCKAAFWFNIPLLKAYEGSPSRDVEIIEQQEKLMRATGQTYSRRFTVQPNGRGGLAVTLIANP